MITASSIGQLNPIRLLWHTVYTTLNQMTSMVGLTPLELAEGLGALFVVALLVQMVQAFRGRGGWDLHDRRPSSWTRDELRAARDELES